MSDESRAHSAIKKHWVLAKSMELKGDGLFTDPSRGEGLPTRRVAGLLEWRLLSIPAKELPFASFAP